MGNSHSGCYRTNARRAYNEFKLLSKGGNLGQSEPERALTEILQLSGVERQRKLFEFLIGRGLEKGGRDTMLCAVGF